MNLFGRKTPDPRCQAEIDRIQVAASRAMTAAQVHYINHQRRQKGQPEIEPPSVTYSPERIKDWSYEELVKLRVGLELDAEQTDLLERRLNLTMKMTTEGLTPSEEAELHAIQAREAAIAANVPQTVVETHNRLISLTKQAFVGTISVEQLEEGFFVALRDGIPRSLIGDTAVSLALNDTTGLAQQEAMTYRVFSLKAWKRLIDHYQT